MVGLGKVGAEEKRTIGDVDRQFDVGMHRLDCDCFVNLVVCLSEDAQGQEEFVSRYSGAECLYNLSILDEVTNGIVNHDGSFKRMSVEFFKAIRQQTVEYGLKPRLLQDLSHLIVDLDLFNLEADYKFNGQSDARSFIGQVGTLNVAVVSNSDAKDISATVRAARLGVRGSLEGVLKIVAEELCDDTLLDGTYEEE